jgi:hypothetical protein
MQSVTHDQGLSGYHPPRYGKGDVHTRFATRAAIAVTVGFALAVIFARADTSGPALASNDPAAQIPGNVALAQAFTAALNAHDVDALVGMFSEEGPGATVHADRYAWTYFEIRRWAEYQVRENIFVEADEYWVTDHGAGWNATVDRTDWRALGMSAVPVFNSIFVQDGKLMDFTSRLANPADAERLQHLWRPGSLPPN